MRLLDLTCADAAENAALDEALLDAAEAADGETLRLWEPAQPVVVVGSSSQLDQEVLLDVCGQRQIPVVRRASGGAAIVTGRGCLMYALVLSCDRRPGLRAIDEAHRFVLERMVAALRPLEPGVERRGISDLVVAGLKFSGNSLRIKRRHLLYHGTIMYDFSLELIAACLKTPPRQPDYRAGRDHLDFVVNVPIAAIELRRAIISAWNAIEPYPDWPREQMQRLVIEKYARDDWNRRR
jgi:lipoate-protein ligase A